MINHKLTSVFFRLTFLILIVALPFFSLAQNDSVPTADYLIYATKKGKLVELDAIVKAAKKYHVVFFGEEHNDSIAHLLQYELFQGLYKKYETNTTLSMEMFDRDVQYILDEYLNGQIKASYFNKDSRKWKNYKDYQPMVEFAKENKLKVIAANAPFRYTNIASRKGQEALAALSDYAKLAIAPLPYKTASGDYKAKLEALMSHSPAPKKDSLSTPSAPKKSSMPKMSYNIVLGQSLWDATMAYSVYQQLEKHPKSKILHLNGRFHTDERFGIVQRLAEYDPEIKALVISSTGSEESFPNIDFEKFKHLGDYVIFTNPKLPKSY